MQQQDARRPERGTRRILASFAVQAALVVALVHLALAVPYAAGWLGGVPFALAAVVLSSFAVGLLALPLSRLLQNANEIIGRFWVGAEEASIGTKDVNNWKDLDGKLAQLHARTLERVAELKAARRDALQQNRSNRRIAQHLMLAQRIARIGSWEWLRAKNRVACSAEIYRLLGIDPSELRQTPASLLELIHEDDRRAFRRWIIKLSQGVTRHGFDLRMRARTGELLHVHVMGEALRDPDGRTIGVVGTVQDATERTHAIQQIHRLAYYDVLTELPNRSRFYEKLAETLDAARRASRSFALMFLDLDQFKRINDTLGHAVGDDLLRIVAQRLTRVLRVDDGAAPPRGKSAERDVCRQGGDEFIVLLNGVATEEQATRAAGRVIEALAQPIMLGTQEVFVAASIGIVLYPRDGSDLDSLLKNADVAMYHAKAEGRNRYSFYHDSMRQATAARLSLERDLRRAIEGEQFELHYQPQIDVQTGRITGMEALVRWNHPVLGMLWPKHFVGVAEEAGLIMAIWEWVFVTALIQHNTWLEEGLPAITISVNMSSIQFTDPALAARIVEIARVVGVPLEHVELEVTESALMRDFDSALATLQTLRNLGVRIAIDDFGTGYSSLSYLRRLPLDKLKFDQAFTTDAVESAEGAAIARAILAMAQSLRLTVVAEGVETQRQIDFLTDLGCTTMQGYLLSRPLPASAMTEFLRRYSIYGMSSTPLALDSPPASGVAQPSPSVH
jgi:diguanylate cyclase (GGDEF)-like protein/PAS domain S-box-containing protein